LLIFFGFSLPTFSITSKRNFRYSAAIDFLDFFSFFFSSVLLVYMTILGSDFDLPLLLRDFWLDYDAILFAWFASITFLC